MTPNEIKMKIEEARRQGVPDDVTFKYLNEKGLIPKDKIVTQEVPQQIAQPEQNDGYNPTFGFTGSENPIQAGLKAAGNIPGSAFNLGKNIVSAIANPIDTLRGVKDIAVGGVQKLIPGQQDQEGAFDAFTKTLKNRYGSIEALAKTATEDPFAFGTDVVSLFGGGASILGKSSQFSKGVSAVASPVTKTASKVTDFVSPIIPKTSKYITSQATGLNPETITELVKNPKAFKNVTPEARIETAKAVKDTLDSRLTELSGLGKEYQVLREAPQTVVVPENTLSNVLNKYGVKLNNEKKIISSAESRPLSPGDKAALQDFIDNYGKEDVLSSNGFLNVREALSNLSKYDSTKTSLSTQISRDLRAAYDDIGKTQIKGLKELDSKYAPERQLLSQLKKDLIDPKTGELKDGAISKIANVTGKGKENLLARMKEIVPDIDQRIRVVKAIEDIERASGIKTGAYTRAIVGTAGVYTGNIPAIIGAILTQPQVAVPIFKGAGLVGEKALPVLRALKSIVDDINNFRLPSQLIDEDTGGLKAGLSVKDISKIDVTPEIKDVVSTALKNFDTTPLTVNGKIDLTRAENSFALEQLKKSLDKKGGLTTKEVQEALGRLKAEGIDPTKVKSKKK